MKILLLCLVAVASANPAIKNETPQTSVSPTEFTNRVVWIGDMVTHDEEDLLKGNPCPAGYPMYSICETDSDCPAKFGCVENKAMAAKFCCLSGEVTVTEYFGTCPNFGLLTPNKYGTEGDRGEKFSCVREFPVFEDSTKYTTNLTGVQD